MSDLTDTELRFRNTIAAQAKRIGELQAELASIKQQEPVAWINYKVKTDSSGEFFGLEPGSVAFIRMSYGYDWSKSDPLYRAAGAQEVQQKPGARCARVGGCDCGTPNVCCDHYVEPSTGAQPVQQLFGYVSEHNCQGPFQYQFHKDAKSVYTDNCKSITPVYMQVGAQSPSPPDFDETAQALRSLDAVEAQFGRNGPTIQLRGAILKMNVARHAATFAAAPAQAQERKPMSEDERGFLVIDSLGPYSLTHSKINILDAFILGIVAAEAHHKIKEQP